jgi:hypothetical protein
MSLRNWISMPGWKQHNRTVSAVLCLLAVVTALADEPQAGGTTAAGQDLSTAFLEFLGEWGDQQGNWQDPLEFEDPKWQSLDDDAERQHDKD